MAIKNKKEAGVGLPQFFAERSKDGFFFQQLSGNAKDEFDVIKTDIADYLSTTTEIEVATEGKDRSIKTPEGSITVSETSGMSVDKAELLVLVNEGKVSIADVIELGTFWATGKIETIIRGAEYERVAKPTGEKRLSLTFRANAAFKQEMAEAFKEQFPDKAVEPKGIRKALDEAIVEAEKPAKKTKKVKAESAEADLEKILKK